MLHELAVAIAATGRRVEMRGHVAREELKRLGEATGAMPELPDQPLRPARGDVVFMSEGSADPLDFAYVALSGARAILLMLAPPGLFGWPFVEGWSRQPPTEVSIGSVARPEHFRAMTAMGFELWTNTPPMVERIRAAGVNCTFMGNGNPVPYPSPLPKQYDVVTLANNRWAELAQRVVSGLDAAVVHHQIPGGTNEEMLRQFGQARVLVHPLRVEGHSRIGEEARAMGAVPVVLNSNPFSMGLDEQGGAVSVSTLEEMSAAVTALLRDPTRLGELRERGMSTARAQVDWDRYVARVDAALSDPPPEDPGRGARAMIGARLIEKEEALARQVVASEGTSAKLAAARAELLELRSRQDELSATFDAERAAVRLMRSTRAWRAAGVYWRARERVMQMRKRVTSGPGGG
jgi:hypothetical protein